MENLVNRNLIIDSFKNKKVFVTGHTGFKGSWLLAILKQLQAEVKGYALNPVHPKNLYNILNDDSTLCGSVIHDIRDQHKLQSELISFSPDFIFHLAAQPLVRYSYENPLETFEVNIIGTSNLLESVRNLSKKCTVIIVTTDKVYHNNGSNKAYKETDPLGGYDPYSASKAAAELVINSYRNSFFLNTTISCDIKGIATARAGNVIGGGDWSKDRIVPDIIQALQKNSKIIVRNPSAIRPWQHVLEPLSGYLLLASRLHNDPAQFSGAWNFGPYNDEALTVKELVEKVIKEWGSGEYKIENNTNGPHEAGLLKLDISKAMNELKWKPEFDITKSIKWTIDWYRHDTAKSKEYTFYQINQYFNL